MSGGRVLDGYGKRGEDQRVVICFGNHGGCLQD